VNPRGVLGDRTIFRHAAHVTHRDVWRAVDAASESSTLAWMAFGLFVAASIMSLGSATSLLFR
jgi:hypothetical protein